MNVDKQTGRDAAKRGNAFLESIGSPKRISFVCTEGEFFVFQHSVWKLYKIIGIDGAVKRQASISPVWAASSEEMFVETQCKRDQLFNGDLEFFLERDLTQERIP